MWNIRMSSVLSGNSIETAIDIFGTIATVKGILNVAIALISSISTDKCLLFEFFQWGY